MAPLRTCWNVNSNGLSNLFVYTYLLCALLMYSYHHYYFFTMTAIAVPSDVATAYTLHASMSTHTSDTSRMHQAGEFFSHEFENKAQNTALEMGECSCPTPNAVLSCTATMS